MPTPLTERFRFFSPVQAEKPFHVIGFTGVEGLHRLFDFHIDLVCADAAVDTGRLLAAPCRFEVLRDDDAAPAVFSGYPAQVEQRGFFNGYAYYAVHLRPTFWKLSGIRQSAVFLDRKLEDVLRELMTSQPFFQFPHEFRLMARDYPKPEFAMQYQESLYDYMCWRMEEQGAYFYFEEKNGADTVVFADAPQSHSVENAPRLAYSPVSGLEGERREEVVVSFSLAQTPLPRRVVLRSYDWRNPNTPVVGMADVDADGLGDVYLSNEYVDNDADAARLATIRAQELRCRSRLFHGTSSAPTLRPGRIFRLDRHYNDAFNRDYLVTEITHEGRQDAYLSLGLGIPLRDAGEHLYYRNTFTCMEADVPYRPARTAPRNRISGVLRAFVAGDGSGARAETDQYGRYKLTFPFDISGRAGGNASCWIRRAQPQVGKDSGLSLPLQPGTEVLVSFVDGNPDLPVIAGALANGETGSISNAGNTNIQGLRTAGGNQITINDTDTKQGISLSTATGGGLTFTAGSLDSAQLTSAQCIETAGLGSAKLAGLFQSQLSGFKSSSSAKRLKDAMAYIAFVLKGVKDTSTAVLDSLSSATKNDKLQEQLQWASAGIKMSSSVLDLLMDIPSWKSGSISCPDYGGTLATSNDAAKTELRVDPTPKELLFFVIAYLLSQIASSGLSGAGKISSVTASPPAMTTYKTALGNAMEALYAHDNSTYALYKKGNSDYEKYMNDIFPCDYYAAVSAELTKCISAIDVRNDDLKKAEKEYREAKKAYDDNKTDTTRKNAFEEKQTQLDQEIKNAKDRASKKEELEKVLSELKTAWNNACQKFDEDDKNNRYYQKAKNASIRNFAVDSVTGLLPEVLAKILLCKNYYHMHKTYERIGGILLQAKDRNITMTAQDSIAMHSQRGILRNTRDLPRADQTSTAKALGAQGAFADADKSTPIKILEPYMQPLPADASQSDKDKAHLAGANAWGVQIEKNAQTHATDFMKEMDTLHWNTQTNLSGSDIRKAATFLADTTELEFRRNRWSYQRSENNAVVVGDKELFLKGGNGIISMQEHKDNRHSLFLSTSDAKGQIRLMSQTAKNADDKPCTEANFSPDLMALGCKPQRNKQEYNAALVMNSDAMLLERGTSLVALEQKGVRMSSQDGATSVGCASDGSVTLTGARVNVADIQFSGASIVGTTSGILDVYGGAVKIFGPGVGGGTTNSKSELERLQQSLHDKVKNAFPEDDASQLKARIATLEEQLRARP